MVVRSKGKARTRALAARVAAGEPELGFDRGIYAHPDVKVALARWQHHKCAFGEAKCTHVTGHVEHFRPKSACDQGDGAGARRPGYWWLAYRWSNLFLACEACNSRHKRNLFPLADPSVRATGPGPAVARERPVFVNPATEDPAAFIRFHAEIPVGVDARGAATIEALGLDREQLSEHRRQRLADLRAFVDILRLHAAGRFPDDDETRRVVGLCRERLAAIVDGSGEYAAMGRATLDLSVLP